MARAETHKKAKKKWSSTTIFVFAFVLFIVVFGVAAAWLATHMQPADSDRSTGLTAGAPDEPTFTEKDARSLLLITTLGNEAQNFLVLRMDPAHAEIQVVSLPRETSVTVGTSTSRLFELYETGTRTDIAAIQESVGAVLRTSIDHYAVASFDEVEDIVAYCGGQLVFTIPEEMRYTDAESTYLRLSPGEQILSGIQVANILRYPVSYWSGGHAQHARVPAELFGALIDQNLTPDGEKTGDTVFKEIIRLLSANDLLISHYYQAQEGLAYLAEQNDGQICRIVTVQGEYVGKSDPLTFYPADDVTYFE